MSILELLRSFFAKEKDESAARAKERLRIVLIQDQSSVSPELMERLRTEMVKLVSRYMVIDSKHLEMGIERKNGTIALAASIPIVRIRPEGRVVGREVPAIDSDDEKQPKEEDVSMPEMALAPGSSSEGPNLEPALVASAVMEEKSESLEKEDASIFEARPREIKHTDETPLEPITASKPFDASGVSSSEVSKRLKRNRKKRSR